MKYLVVFLSFLFAISLGAQNCDPNSLIVLQTRAKDTDAAISWEANRHHSFYNPTCTSRNILVVHLVGSYDNPSSTLLFPSVAANNGFDVVSLKYPNGTAAKTACDNNTDAACYAKFRREILEGVDYSPEVAVDVTNSVYNRLIKLLQYLDANNPSQNWGNYFSGNTILWNKIIVSGHSQGGGHAALIGQDNLVKRVLMFASPNDYSTFFSAPAVWTTQTNATADSSYYGFNNQVDDVVDFSEQFSIWNNLGMPAFGDTTDVDNVIYPYNNTHQLYTKYDTTGIGGNHSVMILDSKTPLNSGSPLFEPVWEYMLGINSSATSIQPNASLDNGLVIYPNPAATKITVKVNVDSSYNLKVYNVLGSLKIEMSHLKQELITINLQEYKSGIYFVKIISEKGDVLNQQFIKK